MRIWKPADGEITFVSRAWQNPPTRGGWTSSLNSCSQSFSAGSHLLTLLLWNAHIVLWDRDQSRVAPPPRDRDTALRLAREKGVLEWQGSMISLYPDFTAIVQEARRKYAGVKAPLRKMGLRYGMLYPARLKVDVDGRSRIFHTLHEAQEFCQQYSKANKQSITLSPQHSQDVPDTGASADLFGTG